MGYPFQGLEPNNYQQAALRTEHTPEFVNSLTQDKAVMMSRIMHGMIGVCTETGELQDMVKKHIIYGKEFDLVNILEEIGDIFWYCALTLDAAGFTMEECMERNLAKLRKRFPDKFSSNNAINRNLKAERKALEDK